MDMQNVSSLQIPEGIVRTIHDKDNRLLWGRVAYNTKYAGDTIQQTYSGKNLWDMSPENRVSGNGWSTNLSTDGEGWITGTGLNDFYNFWTKPSSLLLPNTTYYYVLEIKEVYAANNSDRLVLVDSTSVSQCNTIVELQYKNLQAGGVYTGSFVTKSDFSGAQTMLRSFLRPYNASSKIVFRLSIVATQPSASSFVYEPYVGGIPAPNPDYPQAVQTVTGEQTIDLIGKNLLDVSSLSQAAINVGQVVENGLLSDTSPNNDSRRWNYGNSNWTIILSPGVYTLSETFTKRCTNASFGALRIYTSSGTLLANNYDITDKDHVTNTFTLTETTSIGIMIKIADGECYVQLEKGANATAYEPYQSQSYTIDLGTIELCKIGNYQDKIFNNDPNEDWYNPDLEDNAWYVRKEVGTNQIDVSSGVLKDYANADYISIRKPNDYAGIGSYNYYPILCTHAVVGKEPTGGWNSADGIGKAWTGAERTQFWIGFTNGTTLETMQSMLSGAKLYYQIANPTETQITDATLIGQLNAVHEWLTRYGYNSTVTGNLPIIIDRTNL